MSGMSGVDEVGPVSLVTQWEASLDGQKYAAARPNSYMHTNKCTPEYYVHQYKYTKIHWSALLPSRKSARMGSKNTLHCNVSH